MKRMQILYFASLIFILIMSGCSTAAPIVPTSTPFLQQITPAGINEPPETNMTPTVAAIPVSPEWVATEASHELIYRSDCVTIDQNPSLDSIQGAIIFADKRKRFAFSDLVYFDQDTKTFKSLPETASFLTGYTSPSGEKLFYEHTENGVSSLRLYRLGSQDLDWDWQEDWSTLIGWLDNDRFALKSKSSEESIWLVNTLTRTVEKVSPVLPDLYRHITSETAVDPIQWISVFDPTLSRIIYLVGEDTPLGLVMRDLPEKEELWKFHKWAIVLTKPAWSFDGKYLAAGAIGDVEDQYKRFEYYIVDREGHIKWFFDRHEFVNRGPLQTHLVWAPDNQKLAINIPTVGSPFPLLIVNTQIGEITNLCLHDLDIPVTRPIWSPNSDSMVLESLSATYMVDLVKRKIFQIENNAEVYPIGWLSSIP